MTCREIPELALDPTHAADVSAHLSTCPACRQDLAEQRAFDDLLRKAVASEPADTSAIDQQVRARIHSAHRAAKVWSIAGIAAVILLAVVAWYSKPNPIDSAAAHDHHIELVDHQPRPWLTDRAAIEDLAIRQGMQASLVSTLTPAGYHLAQGKLCFLNHQLFLHLVYENAAGNVSVFLRRADASHSSGIHLANLNTEHVARFQRGQVTAVMVTNQSGQTIDHLAESAAL